MRCSRFASLLLACLVAFLLAAPEADARGRQARARQGAPKSGHAERTVTRTGPDGKTATTHDEVHRTEGGYTRETTHTGPNGGVTTRNASGAYDPETKTWTHDATTTRPDGSTATSHGERTRTEDGYQRTTTHTGPQGTTTVEGQGTWDPATKTWTREKVVTRPDGSTSKAEVTTQVTPVAPVTPAPAE